MPNDLPIADVGECRWRAIESAPTGETIDIWIEGLDGEGWRKTGMIWQLDPLLIYDENNCPYWPHENGGWASHWMPKPAPPLTSCRGGDNG